MVYKVIDKDKMLVKVPLNKEWDFKDFNRGLIEDFVKEIIVKILKKKKLKGYFDVNVYIDKWYGMVIIFDKVDIWVDDNQVDMKITFHLNAIFLYEIDYLMIRDLGVSNQVVYYDNNRFYLEIINEMDDNALSWVLEGANIILDGEDIRERGIVINI